MGGPKFSPELLKDLQYEEAINVALRRALAIQVSSLAGDPTATATITVEAEEVRTCNVCKQEVRAGDAEPGLRWRHRSCHRKALESAVPESARGPVRTTREIGEYVGLGRPSTREEGATIPEWERGHAGKPAQRWWTRLWRRIRGTDQGA